ncbi:probable cytochrome P450 49a1 [Periplaneta americana]|uniref:probable cytochrome P450 49a1 n=1 Tax=Periplaneta americana TaxID=6978 RepID=UPI0037E880A9
MKYGGQETGKSVGESMAQSLRYGHLGSPSSYWISLRFYFTSLVDMSCLHGMGKHALARLLFRRRFSSDRPISVESLIREKKTKNLPPAESTLSVDSELGNEQGFERVTSDLLSNADVLASVDLQQSKVAFPNVMEDDMDVLPTNVTTLTPVQSVTVGSTAVIDVNRQQEQLLKLALPFDEVPGPNMLKFLAKLYSYLPLVGTQLTAGAMMYFLNMIGSNLVWNRSAHPFMHMFDKYGPVVRLQGVFGGNIVFVSRPEHIETVFQQEGRYPVRSSLDSLEMYRLQHRKMRMLGPFLMSGPDWESLRSKLDIPFQKKINQYHAKLEDVADEMVTRIRNIRNRQEEVPATFNSDIYKWALENVCGIVLGRSLGLLQPTGVHVTSESVRLLEAVQNASQALRDCEAGFQMWRLFETRKWRTLMASCDIIDSIIAKYIRQAQTDLMGSVRADTSPLLETLLLTEHIHPDDVLTIVLDMFLIGVNATSHALSHLLYQLSKNPRAQRTVYGQVLQAMPKKDSRLSYEALQGLHYLKACLKESLRLQPPIPVVTRVLPHDIALHSYRIPKGTYMLMTSHVTSLREENFEDATKFKPERWLLHEEDIHPFSAIPFGHGPRACVGRSLAELQLWLTVAKVIRNFRVEYHYGHIKPSTKFIAMPSKALQFRFVERAH